MKQCYKWTSEAKKKMEDAEQTEQESNEKIKEEYFEITEFIKNEEVDQESTETFIKEESIEMEAKDEEPFLYYSIVKEEYTVQGDISNKVAKNHQCLVCGRQFQTRAKLTFHMEIHATEKPYHCPQCPKAFVSEVRLSYHLKTHAESLNLPCEQCDKVFKNAYCLQCHMRVHDPEFVAKFGCEICGKKLKTKADMRNHIKRVHFGIKREKKPKKHCLPCEFCGKIFTRVWGYKVHLKRIHTEDKELPCPVCSMVFRNKFQLREHTSTHEKKSKIDPCSICGQIFRRKRLLLNHMKHHEKCLYCKMKAKCLKDHIRKQHRGLPLELPNGPAQCTICKKLYKNMTSLKAHAKRQHPPMSKLYRCAICKKAFILKNTLRSHIHYHIIKKERNRRAAKASKSETRITKEEHSEDP